MSSDLVYRMRTCAAALLDCSYATGSAPRDAADLLAEASNLLDTPEPLGDVMQALEPVAREVYRGGGGVDGRRSAGGRAAAMPGVRQRRGAQGPHYQHQTAADLPDVLARMGVCAVSVRTELEVARELKHVREMLAEIRANGGEDSLLYGAQQALAWALKDGMSPSKLAAVIIDDSRGS